MKFTLYNKLEDFGADTLEILMENEVQNNLPISFIRNERGHDTSKWLHSSVKDANGADSTWWLRSPGRLNRFAIGIGPNGLIGFTGHGVRGNNKSVRPAMWISL